MNSIIDFGHIDDPRSDVGVRAYNSAVYYTGKDNPELAKEGVETLIDHNYAVIDSIRGERHVYDTDLLRGHFIEKQRLMSVSTSGYTVDQLKALDTTLRESGFSSDDVINFTDKLNIDQVDQTIQSLWLQLGLDQLNGNKQNTSRYKTGQIFRNIESIDFCFQKSKYGSLEKYWESQGLSPKNSWLELADFGLLQRLLKNEPNYFFLEFKRYIEPIVYAFDRSKLEPTDSHGLFGNSRQDACNNIIELILESVFSPDSSANNITMNGETSDTYDLILEVCNYCVEKIGVGGSFDSTDLQDIFVEIFRERLNDFMTENFNELRPLDWEYYESYVVILATQFMNHTDLNIFKNITLVSQKAQVMLREDNDNGEAKVFFSQSVLFSDDQISFKQMPQIMDIKAADKLRLVFAFYVDWRRPDIASINSLKLLKGTMDDIGLTGNDTFYFTTDVPFEEQTIRRFWQEMGDYIKRLTFKGTTLPYGDWLDTRLNTKDDPITAISSIEEFDPVHYCMMNAGLEYDTDPHIYLQAAQAVVDGIIVTIKDSQVAHKMICEGNERMREHWSIVRRDDLIHQGLDRFQSHIHRSPLVSGQVYGDMGSTLDEAWFYLANLILEAEDDYLKTSTDIRPETTTIINSIISRLEIAGNGENFWNKLMSHREIRNDYSQLFLQAQIDKSKKDIHAIGTELVDSMSKKVDAIVEGANKKLDEIPNLRSIRALDPKIGERNKKRLLAGYDIYTNEYDEIIGANELIHPNERKGLHDLQTEKANLDVSPQFSFPKLNYDNPDEVEVTLLMDHSGSMRGERILALNRLNRAKADILARNNINFRIVGHTTSAWKGGKSREKWLSDDRPKNPGRLNDVRTIIYKEPDSSWTQQDDINMAIMLKEGVLKENLDGEALENIVDQMDETSAKRKIIIYSADGCPACDSTDSANDNKNYLREHFSSAVQEIEGCSDIELLGVGVDNQIAEIKNTSNMNADEVLAMSAEQVYDLAAKQLNIALNIS